LINYKFFEKILIYLFFFVCIFAHLSYLIPESITLSASLLMLLIALILCFLDRIKLRRFIFFLLTLIFLIPSLINSEEDNIVIPLLFFILPFLPFVLSPKSFLNNFDLYLLSMKVGVLLAIAGVVVQIFISPNLFGIPGHTIYSGELMGTTSFRPTGFTGSPQNLALFMSVGLFYKFSDLKIINFLIKIAIIITGASTLATFFSGALLIFLLVSFPWILIIILPFLINYLWFEDFTNTQFEFFSISELKNIDERFLIDNFFNFNLIDFMTGYGPGTATQGMIDRFYVYRNIYGAESLPLIFLHEFGLFFTIFFFIILVKILLNSYSLWRLNIYRNINIFAVTIVLVSSIFLTPNFASFRIKMIFIPLFLISLVPANRSGGLKSEVQHLPTL
jgi:hypothetical protein